MRNRLWLKTVLLAACGAVGLGASARLAMAAPPWPLIFPEQRQVQARDPADLPSAPFPSIPAPVTVTTKEFAGPPRMMSLDEAIHVALEQTRVVRVLQGTTATSSGKTIYDAAINNTLIDQQQSKFDPTLNITNSWNRTELPQAIPDPGDPSNSLITGTQNNNYNLGVGVNKLNPLGGTSQLNINTNPQTLHPGTGLPLNSYATSNASIGYSQPFLQGRGIGPNMASIVIARIETERSYFQYKDALQEQVRGVVEAYWSLVAARTDLWSRQRQVEQAEEGYRLANARFVAEIANGADRAQARVTLAQFKANLVTAHANVLQREAALRNILGIPPSDSQLIIPTTQPTDLRYSPQWEMLTMIAQERRPDLVELKLILEADQQQILLANNQALPRLDGVALYRWNGLEGETPGGNYVRSPAGQYTDWTLGVNFSVPLGLRQGRANLRQRELLLSRDQANLQQGLHNAIHILATNVRNVDQAYEQYLAYKEAREAAKVNLDQQFAQYRANRVIFLNVLQAITDWGNSISNEATALTAYNTQLANLERQSGTILETHGVTFYEERFGSIGPWGRMALPASYPQALPPSENAGRYSDSGEPSEEKFDLQDPEAWKRRPLQVPAEQLPDPPKEKINPPVPMPEAEEAPANALRSDVSAGQVRPAAMNGPINGSVLKSSLQPTAPPRATPPKNSQLNPGTLPFSVPRNSAATRNVSTPQTLSATPASQTLPAAPQVQKQILPQAAAAGASRRPITANSLRLPPGGGVPRNSTQPELQRLPQP